MQIRSSSEFPSQTASSKGFVKVCATVLVSCCFSSFCTLNALLAALKCKTLYRYQLNLLCKDLKQKQHLYTDINYVFSVSFAQTFKDALNGKWRCCIKLLFSWEFTDGGKRFFVSDWMSTRLMLCVQLSNIAATDDFPWVQRKTTTVLWEKRQEISVKETESEKVRGVRGHKPNTVRLNNLIFTCACTQTETTWCILLDSSIYCGRQRYTHIYAHTHTHRHQLIQADLYASSSKVSVHVCVCATGKSVTCLHSILS